MPIEKINGTKYYLASFDKDCIERKDDPDGPMTAKIIAACKDEKPTDVFVFSHGWMGDVKGARDQYTRWISVMCGQEKDLAHIKGNREFRPLLIGLHWPSKPWGEESLAPQKVASFGVGENFGADYSDIDLHKAVSFYTGLLGDSAIISESLERILAAAKGKSGYSDQIKKAYNDLTTATNSQSDEPADAPGKDMPVLELDAMFDKATQPPSFAPGLKVDLLDPLRVISYWKMKDLARRFGETAAADLLKEIQNNVPPTTRVHVVGHSFGCVVGSSIAKTTTVPLSTLSLIQGAMSLWSLCPEIPMDKGKPGYFNGIIKQKNVSGPILITTSRKDYAVGRMYPIASLAARQVAYVIGQLPKYGALGTYGACGDDNFQVNRMDMKDAASDYTFSGGTIYNLKADRYISEGDDFFSGAHNDIDRAEVAHAVLQAVSSS